MRQKIPQDYGTLLLGLLLVLSVYRLPSVLRDLRQRQGDFVQRARMVLTCQARTRQGDEFIPQVSPTVKIPENEDAAIKSPGNAMKGFFVEKTSKVKKHGRVGRVS